MEVFTAEGLIRRIYQFVSCRKEDGRFKVFADGVCLSSEPDIHMAYQQAAMNLPFRFLQVFVPVRDSSDRSLYFVRETENVLE